MRRLAATLVLTLALPAQGWPDAVQELRFRSTADGSEQKALWYAPKAKQPVPLLVGLHTWSGDYRQKESIPLASWCLEKSWAFVHPDFRGPNQRPAATGSKLAVTDVMDAIDAVCARTKVDPDRIYLIGTSGGGHMALLLAGQHPTRFAGVSAWVPIFDLARWHRECARAGRKYAKDLERSCGGPPRAAAKHIETEYTKRSPSDWLRPGLGLAIDINAGIHDGHTGSVPVGHGVRAFNALVPAAHRIREATIRSIEANRRVPDAEPAPGPDETYGKHELLLRRTSGRTRLTLFDGGHQGIPAAGLSWLAQKRRHTNGWRRHAIDPATDALRGADGVRTGDLDGDGLTDLVTGWEEGQAIRVYRNPGPAHAREPWPAVTVGRVKNAEDAVFVDLDGDGAFDVVSSCEGRTKTMFVHWCPGQAADRMKASAWKTAAIPATAGEQMWMFALPMQVDGKRGIDLVVGSKGKNGAVGWLESPADPRDLAAWRYHRIVDAGWIMSLRDIGGGRVLVSDRRGRSRGIFELRHHAGRWTRTDLGGHDNEVMFLDSGPVAATRNGVILDLRRDEPLTIPNPFRHRNGKAVAVADLDGDGLPDFVHTANTGRTKLPGVTVLRQGHGHLVTHDVSGRAGSKFDRIELLDLDGDGDLDIVTCEENAGPNSRGLGVIWYENPFR